MGFERRQDGLHRGGVGEGAAAKILVHRGVLATAHQHADGMRDVPAGPADLLVVGNDGIGRLVMDDKAQVGLVVAHAQGVGGDQDLEPVVQQLVFEVLPVGIGVLEVRHASTLLK